MKRSTTPSFITEIPLVVSPTQEKILLKRLEAGRRVYNACLGEALQRAQALRRSPAYQAARAMPAGKAESPERKARSKAFTQARQAVGFGEYDLHAYAKQFGHSYLGGHLDSLVVQAVASRAYHAVNDYLLGKKGRPRFKGCNQFDSVEGKTNKSGLRWKDNRVVWNIRGGRRLILEPIIPEEDDVIRHGLSSPVKYVRIVRRKLNGRNRFSVQLVGKGCPYQKPENPLGQGVVGLDIGPQTIAIVCQTGASLRQFAAELEQPDAEIQALQRQIERQRRANNPDNYYPDRWVRAKGGKGWKRKRGQPKPGKRSWVVSNRQQVNQKRLAELHRKQVAHRKSLHGRLVNDILRMGDRINLEKLSYQAFQKGYGRSTQFRAPGKFVKMLRRKAESAGGVAHEFPTHTTRLSQVCLCGAVKKKPLSQRWHRCACGVVMQRDLFSAFLAMCVEDEKLNAEKAREIWPAGEDCLSKECTPRPGLESVLWAALSEIESVNGAADLPASVGLQRQNGSPRKPEGTNAQSRAIHRPGSGVVTSGTPRL
jgi:transposase